MHNQVELLMKLPGLYETLMSMGKNWDEKTKFEPKLRRILCLDLDGTVRRTKSGKPFIESTDDIEIIPGMAEQIFAYQKAGWIIAGISNQGGVSHGFRTDEQCRQEVFTMINLINGKETWAGNGQLSSTVFHTFLDPFDAILLCYWDPESRFPGQQIFSMMRKPMIGMLGMLEAELFRKEIIPNWKSSLFVGDRPEDAGCASAAGIPFMRAEDFVIINPPKSAS